MLPQQFTQRRPDRGQGQLRIRLSIGAAQVRGHDDLGPGTRKRADGRHRGHDATGIRNMGDVAVQVLEWDVQVRPDQHALARNSLGQQIVEGLDRHRYSDLPTRPTRSTRRFE
ncbi:Uncharacterised protein [Mycobacteroides abscessus subsp. abscessus]|nr:Uncharacterised protein [Mycobacteroides abscessus subsp. abscessus]